jgi:nitrite reductase/ring-hydroxylating ferredoxin subunit
MKCPRHGWQFELSSGRSYVQPDRRIRTYPVTVEKGRVLLEVT